MKAMVFKFGFCAAVALTAAAIEPDAADAEWACNDTINTLVSEAPNLQEDTILVPTSDGGAIVIWLHVRVDYSARDIHAQRIRASGEVHFGWPTPSLPVISTGDYPVHITAVSDNADGAYVAWTDNVGGIGQIFVQHVLASGAVDPVWPAGGLVPVPSSDYQAGPVLVSDGSLGVIVLWGQFAVGSSADIRAHHIFNSGVVDGAWPAGGLGVCTEVGEQFPSAAIPDPEGGAYVVWSDGRLNPDADAPSAGDLSGNSALSVGDNDLYAHHILPGGEMDPTWPNTALRLCFATGNQGNVRMVSDGSGGGIVVWQDERAGDWDYDIYVHHFLPNGTVDQSWPYDGLGVCIKPGSQIYPNLVTDGAGGAYITWSDSTGSNPYDIYAQHLLAGGSLDGLWPVNGLEICGAVGDQHVWGMVPDRVGGALLVWQDPRSSFDDIYAQRLVSGGIAPGWPVNGMPVCTKWQGQWAPSVVMSHEGVAIVAWHDRRRDNTDDIYAQRIALEGSLDDLWEPNDVCSSPIHIPPGGYNGMIVSDGDSDWFRVTIPRSVEMVFEVFYDQIDGDVDIALYDTMCGGTPIHISEGTSGQEIFGWHNSGPTRDFFVHIYLYPGPTSCNDYDLIVDPVGTGNMYVTATPSGWVAPVVPRNQTGASIGNVPLTPVLDGNQPTTYMNWSAYSQYQPLPEWTSAVEVDYELLTYALIPDADPLGWKWVINAGPHAIRGGRHTIAVVADRELQVPETNEMDNFWGHQLIWSPLELSFETPVVRLSPPARGEDIHLNADGMKVARDATASWVVSMAPLSGEDDYDLHVYDDYSGSTAGFSNQIGISNLAFNYTDFVVGHGGATPNTVYPAVSLWGAGVGAEFFIDQSDTRNRSSRFDTEPNKAWLEEQLPPGRLANVYHVLMFPGDTHVFTLLSREEPLEFELFPYLTTGVHARGTGTPGAAYGTHMRTLTYTCTVQGYYPIVVCRNMGTQAEDPATYDFHWYTGVTHAPRPPAPSYTLAFQGAWPNPMTRESQIVFTLSRPGPAKLQVFDVRGRLVGTLLDGHLEAGPHSEVWDGRANGGRLLGAGIYWLRFQAEGQQFVRRVVLLK